MKIIEKYIEQIRKSTEKKEISLISELLEDKSIEDILLYCKWVYKPNSKTLQYKGKDIITFYNPTYDIQVPAHVSYDIKHRLHVEQQYKIH